MKSASLRRGMLLASCFSMLAPVAQAGTQLGSLYIATSTYTGNAATLATGEPLPVTPAANAIANGAYPGVFANDTVDTNFGVTSPIWLSNYRVMNTRSGVLLGAAHLKHVDVTTLTGAVTSFSSKSELGLQLSTDASAITFMGYYASPNAIDLSDTNTPSVYDPTNSDLAPLNLRTVVQYNLANGALTTTPTDAYSGNNGRGAILAVGVNGTAANEYLMAGNGGNGSGTPLASIVGDTGVQAITPGAAPTTTVIGAQQGTPGSSKGFEYGFSVASLGDTADKSGKDDNFRGLTIFNNTLYVTKGSGSNGVNTVYQVGTPGTLPTAATGSSTAISILPGFPTALASTLGTSNPAGEFYPFGLFFANATTLYVADEGAQSLSPADPNAGLQKWIFDGTKWNLAYTIQAGLNLNAPYAVPGYPAAYNPATTGLRHVTGVVNGSTVTLFATTSTFSNLGDPGADPNQVVEVTDQLAATTLPGTATFTVVKPAVAKNVYRGVVFVP